MQDKPIPETMIGQNPDNFWKLKCFNQEGGENPFAEPALAEYLGAFRNPDAIHASCEDYRAAATIDIRHDDEDGGRKLAMPLLACWARKGVIGRCFGAAALWTQRAENVTCHEVDAAHYTAEEIPDEIAAKMMVLLPATARRRRSRNEPHAL